jgi:hypothetical protein
LAGLLGDDVAGVPVRPVGVVVAGALLVLAMPVAFELVPLHIAMKIIVTGPMKET